MDCATFALARKDKFTPSKAFPYLCDDPATPTREPNYSPNYSNTQCWGYATEGPLGPSTVYVVVVGGYGSVRISWNLPGSCAIERIGAEGIHAVVGALYVYAYSADQLRLTPNNNLEPGPELTISDCAGNVTDLFQLYGSNVVNQILGRVDLGGGAGYHACPECFPVSVTRAAWGTLKQLYPRRAP